MTFFVYKEQSKIQKVVLSNLIYKDNCTISFRLHCLYHVKIQSVNIVVVSPENNWDIILNKINWWHHIYILTKVYISNQKGIRI